MGEGHRHGHREAVRQGGGEGEGGGQGGVGTSSVGEGEWQGDRVCVSVEVWEALVVSEKD